MNWSLRASIREEKNAAAPRWRCYVSFDTHQEAMHFYWWLFRRHRNPKGATIQWKGAHGFLNLGHEEKGVLLQSRDGDQTLTLTDIQEAIDGWTTTDNLRTKLDTRLQSDEEFVQYLAKRSDANAVLNPMLAESS